MGLGLVWGLGWVWGGFRGVEGWFRVGLVLV